MGTMFTPVQVEMIAYEPERVGGKLNIVLTLYKIKPYFFIVALIEVNTYI